MTPEEAWDIGEIVRALRRHPELGRTKAERVEERDWLDRVADRLDDLRGVS